MNYLAEIFGTIAFIAGFAAHQFKTPRLAIWVLCIPCILWIMHFFLLAQFSGLLISAAALIRNIGAARLNDRHMKKLTCISLVLCFAIIIASAQNTVDLLPLGAAFAISLAVFHRDSPFKYRASYLGGEMSWLIYGIAISSLSLTFGSALLVISLLISMIRHDVVKIPQSYKTTPLPQNIE